jgi:hypothetical protein
MDWCDFTATYLFEGIREFKQHNWSRIKVTGCVHILSVRNIPTTLVETSLHLVQKNVVMCSFFYVSIATGMQVIFIDLVKNGALKIPGGFPRICFITSQHQDLVNSCYPQVWTHPLNFV